jgi:hypothetical protein
VNEDRKDSEQRFKAPVKTTPSASRARFEICIFTGFLYLLFLAHPYSSRERGTNENSNGMIRRFFPKGTDFSKISKRKIQAVQAWMNNYPRKILCGNTPTPPNHLSAASPDAVVNYCFNSYPKHFFRKVLTYCRRG